MQRAQVSLRDAVQTAEKQGGRAVDAHFRQDEELGCLTDKPSYYEVTLLSRGALRTVDVDARSNQAQLRPREAGCSGLPSNLRTRIVSRST